MSTTTTHSLTNGFRRGSVDDISHNHNAEIIDHINPLDYDDIVRVSNVIRGLVKLVETPTIAVICGSGLGELGDAIKEPQILPYSHIPGFPRTSVVGHKGNLIFGYLGGKYVMCMQGRFHPYEHAMNLAMCAMPVRIMHQMGVKTLIVSNAAGGINPKFAYGDLMLIKDHIFMPGLAGFSPLVGVNDPRMGQRFVSVHDAYDITLRKLAKSIAAQQNIRLHEGIYVMSGGPQYESPAEVCLFKVVGADALGMSTCHEVTVARQCQIRVMGFSLITNIANNDADSAVEVSHLEVLEAAKMASARACAFVEGVIEKIPIDLPKVPLPHGGGFEKFREEEMETPP